MAARTDAYDRLPQPHSTAQLLLWAESLPPLTAAEDAKYARDFMPESAYVRLEGVVDGIIASGTPLLLGKAFAMACAAAVSSVTGYPLRNGYLIRCDKSEEQIDMLRRREAVELVHGEADEGGSLTYTQACAIFGVDPVGPLPVDNRDVYGASVMWTDPGSTPPRSAHWYQWNLDARQAGHA